MTRARRRRCGEADLLLLACNRKRPPRVEEWRDWANLTTDLVRDVAGRLCSDSIWPATEYNRLRAVCKTWCASIDAPRSVCGLDMRFRPLPRGWKPLRDRLPSSRCRHRHVSGVVISVQLDALSSNYIFGMAEGLLVLRDKRSTDVVRLLNPLTGSLTEFPPITEVRSYDGSEQKSREAIDALKPYFSNPDIVFDDFVGIDDSTSPATLVFCVRNNGPLVVYAKPGDHHWVSVHNPPDWAQCSDTGRLAWFFTPPPGVSMPRKIYVYAFDSY